MNIKFFLPFVPSFDNENGASMLEYALLLSLIAMGALSSVSKLGLQTTKTFTNTGEVLACSGMNDCNAVQPPDNPFD